MTTILFRPEHALRVALRENLRHSLECLFAVAYVSVRGIHTLRDVLEERLKRSRFSLRILFRATDCTTEPDALDDLLRLASKAAGTLSLRYSRHQKFHAKSYGFRRAKADRPLVILGSANLLSGALAVDSGELGVVLGQNAAADEAWIALEDFWADGAPVTRAWLSAYTQKYHEIQRKSEAARGAVASWAARVRPKRPSFALPDLSRERFYVVQTERRTAELESRARRAAAAAAESDVEVPRGFYAWEERPRLPADTNLVERFYTGRNRLAMVRLVRLGRVVRAVDPRTKKRLWLVGLIPARRGTLVLRAADFAAHDRSLARRGLTWGDLEREGYLRGRRARFIAALRALGWKRPTR